MDAKEITLIGDIMGTDGVQALSIRPNAATAYGTSGLSAGDLKLWFDKVPTTLVEKIDEVIGIINGVEFAEYIKTDYEGEPKTLADVFEAIGNGDFTAFLQAGKSDGKNGSLQDILDGIYKELQALDLPQDYTLSEYLELFKGGIKAEIENPEGEVEAGEHLPVSGGKVFEAIQEANLDVSALWGRVGDLDETVGQNKEKAEKNEKRIALLEMANEGNTYAFTKHEDIEYNHPVPATALPYARLDSIGGYTRRCKNLLKLTPNLDLGEALGTYYSTDTNGYFCINNNSNGQYVVSAYFDGLSLLASKPTSITISARYISGTAENIYNEDGLADLVICGRSIKLPTSSNRVTTLVVSNMTYDGNVDSLAVGNFTDYKIALMVEEGTTATEYEPYFEGLKSARVTRVESYGKNIYDGEADIALKGAYDVRVLCRPEVEGTTTFSFKRDGTNANLGGVFRIVYTDGTELLVGPTMPSTTHTKKIKAIQLVNWALCEGRVYDIQLERGSKATAYTPYVGLLDTYPVPDAVQALDGYGIGIKTAYNFVDFANKQFGKRVKEVVLTGNETVYSYAFQGLNGVSMDVLDGKYERAKGVCSHGNVVSNASAVSGNMWIGVNNTNVYWLGIMDLLGFAPTQVSKFKEYLAEQYANGTPVRIIYDSTDDTDEPITDGTIDTEYLEVEGGGYIVGVNDGIESNLGITFQEKL